MGLKKNRGRVKGGSRIATSAIAKISILGVLSVGVIVVGIFALSSGKRKAANTPSPSTEIEATPEAQPVIAQITPPVEIPEMEDTPEPTPETTPEPTAPPQATATPKPSSTSKTTPKPTATATPAVTPTPTPTATPASGSLLVTVAKSVISIGEKTQITVYTMPEKIAVNNNDIVVSSSNDKIASIDNSGAITGILGGTVTITAKNTKTGATDSVSLTVDGPANNQSHSLSITVPTLTANLNPASTGTVTVKLTRNGTSEVDNVPNSECTFSSNSTCFSVDASGKITAQAPGSGTLTVTYTKLNITSSVTVTIATW